MSMLASPPPPRVDMAPSLLEAAIDVARSDISRLASSAEASPWWLDSDGRTNAVGC